MKMHILNGGRLRMRESVYLPEAARTETIDLPVACILLRHAHGNVLFDTGCHPDTADDASGRWGYRTPDEVYRSGCGGGAIIVDKYGGAQQKSGVKTRQRRAAAN
jgi:hypothetical protein